jgi:hypothetical protein
MFCCFLWAKGLNAKDIHKEMFPVYGGKCLLHKAVHNWVKKSSQGSLKITDDAQPARLVDIVTEATVQQVQELIRADRRITTDSGATTVGCSHGLPCSIMHGYLNFWEVCAQWLPKELKDQEKINRMGLSLQHILQYTDEGEDMVNRIVTEDESWVHPYQPESKCASLQWKDCSPSTKKLKV